MKKMTGEPVPHELFEERTEDGRGCASNRKLSRSTSTQRSVTDAGLREQDSSETTNHSEVCQARITKAMEGDEEGREKIRRETESIARQVQAQVEGKEN